MQRCIIAVALVICGAQPAAAIECRGSFQIVQGQQLSTPYCRDRQLADVARGYGFRVSAVEVRNNPNAKKELCRLIGRDIRVTQACSEVNGSGRRF